MTLERIRQAIIAGENQEAVAIAEALISKGIRPEEIIIDGVTKAMEYLNQKCTIQEFCLLELMLAGRAAMDVIDFLYSEGMTKDEISHDTGLYPRKKIILGTIKGDIHELGKNIVSMVLKSYGYQVIDMGKDVNPEDLVMAAITEQADIIGISSLLTTTLLHVRDVKRIAADKGLHAVKIIAGGAALQQSSAEFLNVDYVADTVFDGLQYIRSVSS